MIIEVTRVFADYDSDDKEFSKAKAKGKQNYATSKTYINPEGIQLICICEFNPRLLEVWYENDILYLEDDMDKIATEWDFVLEKKAIDFVPDPPDEDEEDEGDDMEPAPPSITCNV